MYNFITDSEVTIRAYAELNNYKIVETTGTENVCAIYFSSHDIYYPNNNDSFNKSIYIKDHYEWTGCLIKTAKKHIFLRDIHKQWYLSGINKNISSPELLLDFLKNETSGMDIVTVGSSAGGYAAIKFGEWLNAKKVFAFSPRLTFEILLKNEWDTNPIAREFALDEINLLKSLTFGKSEYFIFYPSKSRLDQIQINDLIDKSIYPASPLYPKIHICTLDTSHHGIPFPKIALPHVINASSERLCRYTGVTMSPFTFAADFVGWRATVLGYLRQIMRGVQKTLKRKLN